MSKSCAELKTHIYNETGNIQALTEQYIEGNSDYVKQRIPQGTFDVSKGEAPVSVRYRGAVAERAKYINVLVEGTENGTSKAPDCSGELYGFPTTPNSRGSAGCHLPATTITAGYDVFGRSLKGRAWETAPVCAFNLLQTGHAGPYLEMLRRDLPKRGMEEFCTALEDEVIGACQYNFSMVDAFMYGNGVFPALPQGTLDIGYLKRIRTMMMLQGMSNFEIQVGREAFEAAVRDWQASNGYTVQITELTKDATGLSNVDQVRFEGMNFILTDKPKRGYLRQVVGGYEFVEVLPVRNRAGTGDGVVAEPNPDYINCRTVCNGVSYELYEVGFSIASDAFAREALAPVRLAGLNVASMNMDVRMLDGNWIDCNEDNTKFKLRSTHMYGFRSVNPEKACTVLYRVAPPEIRIVDTTCPDAATTATIADIGVAELNPPPSDDCYDDIYATCASDVAHFAHDGTPSDPGPDITAEGTIRFVALSVNVDAEAGLEFSIYVERVGGYDGAASVDVDSANGTATVANGDYVTVNETLNWADGENGRKRVVVTLGATPEAGEAFTINLSNVSGATLDGDADSMTVNVVTDL